jgi:hypothetical protein
MNTPTMHPGRDNTPADHQRRIAQIYHLSERELAHESVEVRQLCRDYRDKLWASEKQAKLERGEMLTEAQALVSERESRLANIKFLLGPIYGSTNYAPIGGTLDRVLNICDLT